MRKGIVLLLAISAAARSLYSADLAEAASVSSSKDTTEGIETEESEFDLSILEGLDGYRYDKFDKAWVYQRDFKKEYSDAVLYISIFCSGNDEGVTAIPTIVSRIYENNGNSIENRIPKYTVTGLSIIVGEDLYDWPKLDQIQQGGSAFVFEDGKDFLKAFGEAEPESVAIRLYCDDSHFDFDESDWDSSFDELQEGCRELYDFDPWKYSLLYEETVTNLSSEYPMEYEPG